MLRRTGRLTVILVRNSVAGYYAHTPYRHTFVCLAFGLAVRPWCWRCSPAHSPFVRAWSIGPVIVGQTKVG